VLAEAEAPSEALARRAAEAVTERTGVRPHALELLAPGTLPRTSSGKLRRAEALRRYLAGTLRPPVPTGALALGVEIARSAAGFARSRLA
jgi:fatty-acyl-CoA synthase